MNVSILIDFNNYYNRRLKYYSEVSDYTSNSSDYVAINDVNFNPADGVMTELIVGKGDLLPLGESCPDYLICYEDSTIRSRWFVMDEDRLRNGQYKLTLKRDVLADFNFANNPIYVEKGIIDDPRSPLLCNNEGLTVNQVKNFENVLVDGQPASTVSEILLKDKTECPWLCMYIKKGALGGGAVGSSGTVTIDVNENDADVYLTLTTPIGQWNMYQYTTTDFKALWSVDYFVNWTKTNTINDYRYDLYYESGNVQSEVKYVVGTEYESNLRIATDKETSRRQLDTKYKPAINELNTLLLSGLSWHKEEDIKKYDGKLIKDSDGKYWRCYVSYSREVNPFVHIGTTYLTNSYLPNLKYKMQNLWYQATGHNDTANDKAFAINAFAWTYRLSLVEETGINAGVNFAAYNGNGTTDSPLFDVICMPYGRVFFSNPGSLLYGLYSSKERSLKVMNELARQLSSQWVLDLQLLPYCPCQDLIVQDVSTPTIRPLDESHQLIYGSNRGSGITDVILVANNATFTFDINKTIRFSDSTLVSDAYKTKYINDCTLLRLCSPNYNGLFDMNLAKNGGSIEYFNIDITMRPQNPYIHVNPSFNFLYGKDFDDTRGLICNGDFSLGIINDAWVQYEIQNKNYQAIFDRQIQNMDVNNRIAQQEAGFQAVAGTFQGAASGAIAGGLAGGGWGAAAGAVVGGITGMTGGVMDYQNTLTKIKENRSFAIDNYNLSLGNVKALPYSITKTSAITANNKFFPFIEVYQSTEKEKIAYYNKIKYDGMTIGIIENNIDEYRSEDNSKFFKGELIRFEGDAEIDFHMANEINNELKKGVYI